jgi:hypothetical protein
MTYQERLTQSELDNIKEILQDRLAEFIYEVVSDALEEDRTFLIRHKIWFLDPKDILKANKIAKKLL